MTIPENVRAGGGECGPAGTPAPEPVVTLPSSDATADATGAPPAEPVPQRKETRFLIPVVAIVALLLIAAAYTGYWMVAATQLEARFAGWIDERQEGGYRIDHGAITRSGYPRHVRLKVAGAEIAAPAGWVWRTPALSIGADPLAPRELQLDLFGRQELRLPPGLGGEQLTVQADRLTAEVEPTQGSPVGSVAADRLTVRFNGAAEEGEAVHVGHLDLVSAPVATSAPSSPLTSRHYSITLADLVLPAGSQLPLGDRVQRFSLSAEVEGDLSGGQWPASLARWRDDGGTIEISSFSLEYGSLLVHGDGTLALDRSGEPIGAFSLRARGLPETLRLLADKGVISPLAAAGASFVFRPPNGQPNGQPRGGSPENAAASVNVPASVQDRKLYIGPLPIARMPSPPWVPLPATEP